jgi:hypothetical protein
MDGFPAEPMTGPEFSPKITLEDLTREELIELVKQSASSIRGHMIRAGMAIGDSEMTLCWRLAPGRWIELEAEPGTFDRLKAMFVRS